MKESLLTKKKFPGISGKFFPPGGISGKISPGDFRGTPGKISGNPGNSRKFPENLGVFSGFPGWKRGLPPKIRGLFPRKRGPPEKIPGIFRKIVPREIPEIPGNSRKFSPEFPGGVPEGVPRTFQLRIEDFWRKIWPKFGQKWPLFRKLCPPKIPENDKNFRKFSGKMAIFGGSRLCWVLVSRDGPPEISGEKKKSSEKKSVGFFLFLRFFEKKRVFLSFRFGTQGRPSKFPDFFSEKSTKKWPKISRNFPPGISGNSGVDFGKPLCNDVYTTKNRVKNFPEKPRKNGKKSEKNFAFFFPNFSKKSMFFNVSALQRLINVINLQFSKSENSIKIYKKLFFDKILYNVL